MTSTIIIMGASSKIAEALIEHYLEDKGVDKIVAISRHLTHPHNRSEKLVWLSSDYSESSISEVIGQLREHSLDIKQLIVCNGFLHDLENIPEKQIKQINPDHFIRSMQINTLTPILLIKHFLTLLPRNSEAAITVFSARVGSISDNGLGGWYSYRASKAALNMMMRTLAVEVKRSLPNVRLLCFHPGTTDTPLSQPFQKNVPEGKLFTADFVAQCLVKVIAKDFSDNIAYVDWQGKTIAW